MPTDNYLKKELYELIKTNESIFDFIQDSSLDGLWYWDIENPENEWMNAKFWTVLGYNPDKMPHKSNAWQNIINHDDLKLALDNFTKHCENPNHPYDQIVRYTHKNGYTIWIRCRGLAIRDKNGKPMRMLGAHHNITEIKNAEFLLKEKNEELRQANDELIAAKDRAEISEKQFRQLFENMEQGFAVHQMIYNNDNKPVDYRFLLINKAFERLTGVNASDFLNKTVKEVLPNIEQKWIDNYGKVAQTGIPLHFDNYSKDFYKYYDVIAYSPKKDFFAVVFTDITDIKESETKLQQLNADKDRFISILSHDLKSPFNALLGFSELLTKNIREFDINQIEEYANYINISAQNANNLLEDLLKWARAQKGDIPFNPQSLNLTEICEDILTGLYQNADEKKIKINYSAFDNLYVIADIDMLKTILRNLVSNAIKFTNNGGEISINAEQTESDITITVSDNGIGIPPDNLSRLFDISEVITTKGTAQETGTGLGLLLCKEFVEIEGGKIWVESTLGEGSKFKFTLPKKYEQITAN